jgi:hypothetical protein
MCRLAVNQELQQHYVFAKASLDCPDVKDWVKQEGIRGIPHIAVYEQSGDTSFCGVDDFILIICSSADAPAAELPAEYLHPAVM